MWNIILLGLGIILSFGFRSQPAFLGGVLIVTGSLGIVLNEFDLHFLFQFGGSLFYLLFHLLAIALSPLQILWSTSKPPPKTALGTVIHYIPSEDEGSAIVDIVAVHGLGSNPDWAWQHEGTGAMWLKDFLPSSFPKARIMAFNHNSAWNMNAPAKSVEICGSQLLASLNTQRQSPEEGERPIIFIGHSFGGIIIKKALVTAGLRSEDRRYKSINKSMIGAIFLGVPHDGSRLSLVGKLMSYATYWLGSSTELLEALKPGERSLRTLDDEFHRAYRGRDIVNFFEVKMTAIGRFPLLIAVDHHSSTSAGIPNIALEADHVGMNKFHSPQDENYKLLVHEIRGMVEKIEKATVTPVDESEVCLRSLDWEGSGNRQAAIEPAYKETLGWVASNPVISEWLQRKSRILWILGKPGSGKSTLSKFLFGLLKRSQDNRKPGQAILTFFFSNQSIHNDFNISDEGCLRSLLFQLLQQVPELLEYILPKYQMKRAAKAPVVWHIEELRSLLISMLGDSRFSSTRIIIDALDECHDHYKIPLLDFITGDMGRLESLQIIITTRMHPEFCNYLVGSPQLKLEAENNKDIESYLSFRLKSLSRSFSLKELDALVKSATLHAHGVFLWAEHIIPILKEQPPDIPISELEDFLLRMPKPMQDMYDSILQKLELAPIVEFDETRRMLEWVLFAERPLKLDEFRFALAVGLSPGFTSLASLDEASYLPSLSEMEARINRLSGGLLEVGLPEAPTESTEPTSGWESFSALKWNILSNSGTTQNQKDAGKDGSENHVVRFMHQSVKEFLLERRVSSETWIDPKKAHRNLASVCIAAATSPDFPDKRERSYFSIGHKEIPFLKYATDNWEIHASSADVEGDRQMEAFGWPESRAFSEWFSARNVRFDEREWIKGYPDVACFPLTIAMRSGLLSDIEFFLEAPLSDLDYFMSAYAAQYSLNSDRDRYREEILAYSLATAVAIGYEKAARHLIEWGADVNAVVPYTRIRILTAAAEKGQNKMIKLLAEKGTHFNYAQGNPLLSVIKAKPENLETLQSLIDHGIDLNARGISIREVSEHDVVNRAILSGTNDEIYDSPLQAAIHAIYEGGSESVVSLLLKNGADARDQCFYRPNVDYKLREATPLHTATYYNYIEIMQNLIKLGEDVNVIAGLYGTPLHVAASFGHEDATQLLLNNGAKFITGVGIFGTPLQAAAFGGHAGVVRRLLELPETDVNDLSGCYGHALHGAAISANKDVMRDMLKLDKLAIILWNMHGEFYMEERYMQYFDWEAWMGHRWYEKTEDGIQHRREEPMFSWQQSESLKLGPPNIQYTDTPEEREKLRHPLLERGNKIFKDTEELITVLINSTRFVGYFVYPLRPIEQNSPASLIDPPQRPRPGYQLADFKPPIPTSVDKEPDFIGRAWRLPEFFWSVVDRPVKKSTQSSASPGENPSTSIRGGGNLLEEKYKLTDGVSEAV